VSVTDFSQLIGNATG